MIDYDENGKSDVICICTQSISKQDWQDHQIVCPKRRYTCPSYLSFICITKSNEYSLSLVDSNCPPSLKEIAKLQVLQSEKGNSLEWLESNKIPFKIIHTLRKECPTFGSMQEMMNHVENGCPYWKVKCMDLPFINHLPYWSTPAHMMIRNSHKVDKCLEISRREFISHSAETALDPISQKIRAIPMIFPYYCKICDQYLPSSGTHICIKEINSIDKQIYNSEILCPGCKLTIRVKSEKEFENTCENCRNNKIGVLIMIPFEHQEKEIVKWKNGIKERRVKWSVIKTLFSHNSTI